MQETKIEINKSDGSATKTRKSSKSSFFEKVSFYALIITIFLMPLFFLPSKLADFDSAKSLLIIIGVLISLIFWCLARLKDGKFELIRSYIFPSVLFLVIIYLLSSIFSGNKLSSLLGRSFELGTFGSVFIGFILMFLSSSVFKTKKNILHIYGALFASFLIISLFFALRLFLGASFLPLGYFADIASNTIGKWNELAIYFGISTLLSVATLELASLSRVMKILLYFTAGLSIFFISVINFSVSWYVIGIFALLFIIYKISFRKSEPDDKPSQDRTSFFRNMPYLVLIILIVSAAFIVDGRRFKINGTANNNYNLIGGLIANYFKISQIEIRPSFRGTFGVFTSTLKENPILGSGPNRFVNEWLLYKTNDINNTPFWNVNFNYGVGTIPTFVATTGILGLISWIVFLLLFIYTGFKFIFINLENKLSRYLLVSSFLSSLYLWIMNAVYPTGETLFFMTLFFSGVFVAVLANEKLISVKSFSYLGNPRRSLVSVPLIIVVIISSITGGYIYYQKFFSSIYFLKAVNSLNLNGSLEDAEKYAVKSLSYSKTDSQYRLLSDIYLSRLNALATKKDITADMLEKEIKPLFEGAVNAANSAIKYDETNYQNYILLGRIYELVMQSGGGTDKMAYKKAQENYDKALKLSPNNPEIVLILGRLEVVNKDNNKAREYLSHALQLKNDYTEAAFLLAQIEVSEGNIKNAIKLVEVSSKLLFNDPAIQFQLGVLKYSDKEKDYKGAAEAFERAVTLNQSYSNARYFLGLSYYNLNRTDEAIKQFEIVQSLNPDNKEVELILKNLKEGRAPFVNAAPPADNKSGKKEATESAKATKTKKR